MKIFLRSDINRTTSKPKKIWDIHKTHSLLNKIICNLLPFLHALSGCDTTSRLYGVSKSAALKLLIKSAKFQEIGIIFMASNTKKKVARIGEQAIMLLLG